MSIIKTFVSDKPLFYEKAWPFEAYGVGWLSHESGWILDETILLSQEPKKNGYQMAQLVIHESVLKEREIGH